METITVTFTTSPVSRHENSERESRAHREQRAKAEFGKAKSITFLGALPLEAVKAIADGKDVLVAPMGNKPYSEAGKCTICHGTHRAGQASKTTWYRNENTKTVFALSDTCRADYLASQGIERILTNPEVYRSYFPKAVVR